jgi:hypothetical protein
VQVTDKVSSQFLSMFLFWQNHSEVCVRFLYKSCVRNRSCKSCKTFHSKFLGVSIPARSTIFKLVKRVLSPGSFLDKKYTR